MSSITPPSGTYKDWPRRLGSYFPDNTKYLVGAFLLWRALLYLGAYVASTLTAANPTFAFALPLSSVGEFLFGTWIHWDAAWYLRIIQEGYSYQGPGVQASVAFFPLYPTLVTLLVRGLGLDANNYRAVAAAGIFVSNLAALAGVLVLYRLTKYEWELRGVEQAEPLAFRTALLFLFFPTTIFFATLYTEALFACLVITSFFFLRRQQFVLGGLFGALASMCRVQGALLLIPFLVEYLQRWRFRPSRAALSFVLVPMGVVLYSGFLFFSFDEPLAFLRVQTAPGWHGPGNAPFYDALGDISNLLHNPTNVLLFLQVSYAVGLVVLVGLTLRYLPLSYGVYAVAAALLPISVDLVSIQRYTLGIFPIFMTLGLLSRSEMSFKLLMGLFVFMLGVNTIMWINGMWVG
jgi:hypothetical protein